MNSENSSGSKKKKIVASAVAVVLAAALLVGSTLSYLQDTSDDVENDFKPHGNSVSISEDGATDDDEDGVYTQEFDIVPGTTDKKDPEVTAVYTLDSYVFLLVDDDTKDLVDYEINTAVTDDSGNITSGIWTKLYDEDDEDNPIEGYAVYYKLVTTEDETNTSSGITVTSNANEDADDEDETDDEEESEDDEDSATIYTEVLNVIKGGTVSYLSTLTNDDMWETTSETDEDGSTTTTSSLKSGITLSFKALIIQAEPFTDAAEALLGYLGQLGKAETDYDDDDTSDTILKVSVNTTIASTEEEASTSTTFTVTIPAGTMLTTSSDSNNDTDTEDTDEDSMVLYLIVTEVSSETGEDIVEDSDYNFKVGDYTYDISLVDENGYAVSSSDNLIQVDIQLAAGLTAVSVTHSSTKMTAITNLDSNTSEGYYYDSTTGVLSIYTKSFSEYGIAWGYEKVSSASDLSAAFTEGAAYVELMSNVSLTSELSVPLKGEMTLDLNGHTLSADTSSSSTVRAINVQANASLTIEDSSDDSSGTISGFTSRAIYLYSNSTLVMDGGTISSCSVSGNGSGGAIYMSTGSTFTMNGGTITGCSSNGTGSKKAGAVYVNTGCTFTMNDGTISDNTTVAEGSTGGSSSGGAIYLEGTSSSKYATFIMTGGTISGNSTLYSGGGVYMGSYTIFTMSGGSITKNSTTSSSGSGGGGIYVSNNATFTMSGGSITSNHSAAKGGGIYITGAKSSVTVVSNNITDNTRGTSYTESNIQCASSATYSEYSASSDDDE